MIDQLVNVSIFRLKLKIYRLIEFRTYGADYTNRRIINILMGKCHSIQFGVEKQWYDNKTLDHAVIIGPVGVSVSDGKVIRDFGKIQFVFTDLTATEPMDTAKVLETLGIDTQILEFNQANKYRNNVNLTVRGTYVQVNNPDGTINNITINDVKPMPESLDLSDQRRIAARRVAVTERQTFLMGGEKRSFETIGFDMFEMARKETFGLTGPTKFQVADRYNDEQIYMLYPELNGMTFWCCQLGGTRVDLNTVIAHLPEDSRNLIIGTKGDVKVCGFPASVTINKVVLGESELAVGIY